MLHNRGPFFGSAEAPLQGYSLAYRRCIGRRNGLEGLSWQMEETFAPDPRIEVSLYFRFSIYLFSNFRESENLAERERFRRTPSQAIKILTLSPDTNNLPDPRLGRA
jgi:hypothetical protein